MRKASSGFSIRSPTQMSGTFCRTRPLRPEKGDEIEADEQKEPRGHCNDQALDVFARKEPRR